MIKYLERVDVIRKQVGRQINQNRKSELGQFMTPATIANFMSSLFSSSDMPVATLLDAGAGIGSLSCAFLDRWANRGFKFQRVKLAAYEIDDNLRGYLSDTLTQYQKRLNIDISLSPDDFIEEAVKLILEGSSCFSHAILNPPYRKIKSDSRHRLLLRQIGIETVNLYFAFVALAIELMQPGGEIVAIIPRSFCNGPYYQPFRELILSKTAIRHVHLFEARDRAFKDDDVLQENIIILLERDAKQGDVEVSTSTDDSFNDFEIHSYPFNRIVVPGDIGRFIHVPTTPNYSVIERSSVINASLSDIGISVSTGPVVDFRVKPHITHMPENGSVPLIYPQHFSGISINWPRLVAKKPNAIFQNSETKKLLFPNGYYVVVRRFSSKEEKRRIVASFVNPGAFNDSEMLGFENRLNVFHSDKSGIDENLALGLTVFLNCTAIDEQFRRFSGHTQVNATDLRLMKYPNRDILIKLGIWAKKQKELSQEKIDRKLNLIAGLN